MAPTKRRVHGYYRHVSPSFLFSFCISVNYCREYFRCRGEKEKIKPTRLFTIDKRRAVNESLLEINSSRNRLSSRLLRVSPMFQHSIENLFFEQSFASGEIPLLVVFTFGTSYTSFLLPLPIRTFLDISLPLDKMILLSLSIPPFSLYLYFRPRG